MKLTQEQVIEKIKNGAYLEDFPEWQDNKEVVLKAVKKYGWNLEYASERLRDDKGVVLVAVKEYGYSLMYASERLRDNKEVVLEAVKNNRWALEYASDRFKEDLLLQTVRSFGYKGSIESIELVKHSGGFLSLLTTEERNNKEIVLEAVRGNRYVLSDASPEIRDKVGNNNPVEFLEQWIKSEKQQEFLDQRLDKKEKNSKIKI